MLKCIVPMLPHTELILGKWDRIKLNPLVASSFTFISLLLVDLNDIFEGRPSVVLRKGQQQQQQKKTAQTSNCILLLIPLTGAFRAYAFLCYVHLVFGSWYNKHKPNRIWIRIGNIHFNSFVSLFLISIAFYGWFFLSLSLFICHTHIAHFHSPSIILYGQFEIKHKLMHKRKINFRKEKEKRVRREKIHEPSKLHRLRSDKWFWKRRKNQQQ